MKLHVAPPSPRAIRVLAVAHHLGLDPDVVPVDLVGGDQRKPAFRALNPNGKMPVLEDDGFVLWESNAIMQYLAAKAGDRALWPSEPRRQADVSRWQCWELAHWGPAAGTLVFERFVKALFGQGGPTPSEVERGEREFHQYAAVLDLHLRQREWLAGDAVTLADMTVGSWLVYAQHYPVEPYREVLRWYDRLQALPAWRKALPLAPPPARQASAAREAAGATTI
ncbi:MAG TPA: glutathione S-transferase family protein [Candidatus Binatia bacterium]|nr:glutathione S-transferase family protein [Candidatus Binatia bacterium]